METKGDKRSPDVIISFAARKAEVPLLDCAGAACPVWTLMDAYGPLRALKGARNVFFAKRTHSVITYFM